MHITVLVVFSHRFTRLIDYELVSGNLATTEKNTTTTNQPTSQQCRLLGSNRQTNTPTAGPQVVRSATVSLSTRTRRCIDSQAANTTNTQHKQASRATHLAAVTKGVRRTAHARSSIFDIVPVRFQQRGWLLDQRRVAHRCSSFEPRWRA
jgi:hypothetical protein